MKELAQTQLAQWVAGNSVHNTDDDECCPDFSCCNKDMHTPKEVRERFAKAVHDDDEQTRLEMLGMFLGQSCQAMGANGNNQNDKPGQSKKHMNSMCPN